MKQLLAGLFAILVIFFSACQKEVSFETGGTAAQGTLKADAGGLCLPKTVNGIYIAGTVLVGTANYIQVEINVSQPGTYTIYTDTVNGYYFRATGNFTATGAVQIQLKGIGTPLIAGNNVFTVNFDSTQCDIAVQVLPVGSGGPAAFTLTGAPGACGSPVILGNYVIGTALTASNTVTLSVNVTAVGTYNITTTAVQGISFAGSGVFTNTGAQTITLAATGTPVAPAGAATITVTAGSSTCTFTCTILTTPPPIDYFPRTSNSNWSYEVDNIATDSLHQKVIAPTHTVLGNTYNIFMATDDAALGYDTSGYYRKSGNDYFRYTNLADYLGFDNNYYAEFNFLKDNSPAGTAWTTTGFSGTIGATAITIRIKFTILQKDITHPLTTSLGTINYPNTIVVEEKYEAFLGGVWQDATSVFGSYKDYYSRNVGWILSQSLLPTGALDSEFEMRRYAVY
jgi:hypothetical protein